MEDRGRESYSSYSSFSSPHMKPAPVGSRGRGTPAYPESGFGSRNYDAFGGPSTGRGRGRGVSTESFQILFNRHSFKPFQDHCYKIHTLFNTVCCVFVVFFFPSKLSWLTMLFTPLKLSSSRTQSLSLLKVMSNRRLVDKVY